MVALKPWETGAGPWVAYRDEPWRQFNSETKRYEPTPDRIQRIYLWQATGLMAGSTSKDDCVRFNTKAEALAAARTKWPYKVKGCRIGAERVD